MNEIQTYHICHVAVASLPFINPLPGPHGIEKCPSYSHFRISLEGCEFRHISLLCWYCFSSYIYGRM